MLGSTLHFIEDKKIDSGAIIARTQITMRPDKSYLWNVLHLYHGGCQLIQEAISSLASEISLSSISQDGPSHYYSYPTEQNLIEFDKRGFTLFEIDDLGDFQIGTS